MGGVPTALPVRPAHPARSGRGPLWPTVATAALAAVTVLVGGTKDAAAHGQLVSVSPANGSTVSAAPVSVVLTFSEAVSSTFAVVRVSRADGEDVSEGRAAVEGAVVTQRLTAPLDSGLYTVAYRVVSSDGHPVSSTTTFRLAGESSSSRPTPATASATASGPATTRTASEAAMEPPTNVFDKSHMPGFIVVGMFVLGATTLLLFERRRGPR
jgi:methionine-rich copper-binding protein CopC